MDETTARGCSGKKGWIMVRRIGEMNGLLEKTVGMQIAYESGRGVLSVIIQGLEGGNSLGLNFRIPSHLICVFKSCYRIASHHN